jgi:ABC-type sugar transport system permease subunit
MRHFLEKVWKGRVYYLFLLPAMIPMIIFGYIPGIQALTLSFTSQKGDFVGLQNFVKMANDITLINSIKTMLTLLIASLITGNVPAFIMAEILFNLKSKRFSSLYRFLFIIPMMIPGIVFMLVWQYMIFDPAMGLANALLSNFGINPLPWMGGTKTVILSFIIMGFPWMAGTNLLIYLAGIQNISESVIESSLLDGARILKRIFKIDIPLILGQIKLLFMLGIIGGLQAFGTQLMTTNGGPSYASMVPGLWMYHQAFRFGDFHYSSAIGLSIFIVIMILTYVNMKYIKTEKE